MTDSETNVEPLRPLFSAALLVGGRSRRMGTDKAALLVEGESLWKRQIRLLQSSGLEKIVLSGPVVGPWQQSGLEIVEDSNPGSGPLGAIASILQQVETPLVLVLAVDLPEMTAPFLRGLLAYKRPVVCQRENRFEPLVAVYAKTFLDEINSVLRMNQRSLQPFLEKAVRRGLIVSRKIEENELDFFRNLNTPADYSALTDSDKNEL